MREAPARTRFSAYAGGWFALAGAFAVNGAVRESTYGPRLGELRAHQVSAVTVLPLLAAVAWHLERRHPIATRGDALGIGGGLAVGAMAFDLVLGHLAARVAWRDLLREYDIRQGRAWGIVVLAIAAAPPTVQALLERRARRA